MDWQNEDERGKRVKGQACRYDDSQTDRPVETTELR
jgi:hypothetical protein